MASYSQTPGILNLSFLRGDDFSVLVDASVNLTNYQTSASISSVVTGQSVMSFTVATVSATEGKVNLSLTDTQTASLAKGSYSWSLVWTESLATRTAISGMVEVL